jgi:hypothetical protein
MSSVGALRSSSHGSSADNRRCSAQSLTGRPAPFRDCSFPPPGCRSGILATPPVRRKATRGCRLRNAATHPKPDDRNPQSLNPQNLKPTDAAS